MDHWRGIIRQAPNALSFPGPVRPIRVRGVADVVEGLAISLPAWPAEPLPEDGSRPDIVVWRDGDRFAIDAEYKPKDTIRARRPLMAARWVSALLVTQYVGQSPELVQIHGASVEIDGRAIVLLGDSLAGKSTVGFFLMHDGCRMLGDDSVILHVPDKGPVESVALGISPRVRLPLPADADESHHRYVATRSHRKNDQQVYLRPAPGQLAENGLRLPVAAVLLLKRRRRDDVAFRPAGPVPVMRWLISKIIAPHLDSAHVLRRARRFAINPPWYELRYGSAREAARSIRDRFGAERADRAAG